METCNNCKHCHKEFNMFFCKQYPKVDFVSDEIIYKDCYEVRQPDQEKCSLYEGCNKSFFQKIYAKLKNRNR